MTQLDRITPLELCLIQTWPVSNWRTTRQIAAVSGGADSVAMLLAILGLAPDRNLIDVAHFNHGWRAAESDADETFVRELCERLGVRLFVGRTRDHEAATQPKKSEESARETRYSFLVRTAYDCGARYILTGHTANDRVETLLHNLFRGSGLAGAVGPAVTRALDHDLVLVRPLIRCWRNEVEAYLAGRNQTFRQDSSNADTDYRRNFLRNRLLPLLREEYGSDVDARLLSFSELAAETVASLHELANDYVLRVEKLAVETEHVWSNTCVYFPKSSVLPAPWTIVREALTATWLDRNWPLKEMSRGHWESIRTAFLDRAQPIRTLPGCIQLTICGRWIRFSVLP